MGGMGAYSVVRRRRQAERLRSKSICLAGFSKLPFFLAWRSEATKPEFKQALRVLIQGVGVATARSLSGPLSSLPRVIC